MAYNIADLIEHAVDLMGDRIALETDGRHETYTELDQRANGLAHTLRRLGVEPGESVGLYSRNNIEAVESMVAIFKARAVMVNVNFRYVESELEHIFTDSDMKVLIVERQYVGKVANVLPKAPKLTSVIVVEDGSDLDTAAVDGLPYEQAIADGGAERDFEPRSNDDVYMLYTGGTTGNPKGVVWRQEDVFRVLGGGIDWYTGDPVTDEWHFAKTGADGGQLVRFPIPPFIHGGSQWAVFQALFQGGKAIVYPEFGAHQTWEIVERHKVNVIFITGDAMGRPMIDALEEKDYDISSVVSVASSAALFSASVKDQFIEKFPNAIIIDAIGSSETGFSGMGVISKETSHSGGGPRVKADLSTVVLREDGSVIEPGKGEVGILARTGHIPLRYYNDPVKTDKTFKTYNGIRYSIPGDQARVEDDGTVTMLGRGSVSINSGGEKIHPEEVESALKAHPDVFDTVVVGVPDERYGQRVAAIVATRDGLRPTLDEINAVARQDIAGYKCPRSIWFVDEIKRSPAGKPNYRWGVEIAESRPADETLATASRKA
ncbi:acyl-CoA synthetase [Williamsia sp. 1135]|uniref:acyl-CoA synthetase n=1 Tax=Williamsia sp. 1135 TaxID=1889262 RepID=UPI000A0FB60F|nr:acyl-CoA synthetase [Williamsia sp. 1135]ORM35141.1 acyl-CoA synthetase [Williamsia sp. 1135]